MKKFLSLVSILFIILLMGNPVFASDITEAIFYGTIRAANTGGLAENVSANVSISTPNLIASGVINSSANNVAILNSSRTDTAFMPGYVGNPWVVWYSSVSANSTKDVTLYTNTTGGKIRYFPGDNGMRVPYDSSLAFGENFTIEVSGWFDTTRNGTTENWILPTDFVDEDTWATETNAFDDNTGTAATAASGANTYTGYLDFTHSSITVNGGRFWTNLASGLEVDFYYSSAWHNVYSADPADNQWVAFETEELTITAARVRLKRPTADTKSLYEFQFLQAATNPIIYQPGTLTVYSPSSGNISAILYGSGTSTVSVADIRAENHTALISLSGEVFSLQIDSGTPDTASFTGATNNYTGDITFAKGNTIPYVEYAEIKIGGIQTGYWAWEYGENFTDQSGHGNTATPTFRTSSSDSDVTASLSSFTPISLSQVSESTAMEWGTMVTDAPEEPSTSYSENSTPGIFFEPLVKTIATAAAFVDSGSFHGMSAADYEALFWYNFAFLFIMSGGILVYFFFAKNNQQALLLKCITMLAIMIFWSLPGPNIYGMFVPLYFGFWCVGVLVLSKSWGW